MRWEKRDWWAVVSALFFTIGFPVEGALLMGVWIGSGGVSGPAKCSPK